jgi:hypothetical protein
VEYPKRKLFKLPSFLTGPVGLALLRGNGEGSASADEADRPAPDFPLEARVLQSILDQPGRPLLTMPGAALPYEPEPVR